MIGAWSSRKRLWGLMAAMRCEPESTQYFPEPVRVNVTSPPSNCFHSGYIHDFCYRKVPSLESFGNVSSDNILMPWNRLFEYL